MNFPAIQGSREVSEHLVMTPTRTAPLRPGPIGREDESLGTKQHTRYAVAPATWDIIPARNSGPAGDNTPGYCIRLSDCAVVVYEPQLRQQEVPDMDIPRWGWERHEA